MSTIPKLNWNDSSRYCDGIVPLVSATNPLLGCILGEGDTYEDTYKGIKCKYKRNVPISTLVEKVRNASVWEPYTIVEVLETQDIGWSVEIIFPYKGILLRDITPTYTAPNYIYSRTDRSSLYLSLQNVSVHEIENQMYNYHDEYIGVDSVIRHRPFMSSAIHRLDYVQLREHILSVHQHIDSLLNKVPWKKRRIFI